MTSLPELCSKPKYEAIVIGAGPNGLSTGIVLAAAGLSVLIVEARNIIGGGCRSAALTLPGYIHDICSSIHPLGIGSPYFRTLPLGDCGLKWCEPLAPLAHPYDNGKAVVVERSIEETAAQLEVDERAYLNLLTKPRPDWEIICQALLKPFEFAFHPINLARFGLRALLSAEVFARSTFKASLARGLFAGIAAHGSVPLTEPMSAATGLVLGMSAHTVGWPTPEGGAQNLSNALARHFENLGGEIVTSYQVSNLEELPRSRLILCDLTPRQLIKIAGSRLPAGYSRALASYQYGPAVFKIDWALDGPIPWASGAVSRAGTVHLGGTMEEIAESEQDVWLGKHPSKPYVLLAQNSLFDHTRAPEGKHTAWAYCHVPHGSTVNMIEPIENQIERFAPGFRKLVLHRSTMTSKEFEQYNQNCVGGDINGGAILPTQLFTRPVARAIPYATPVPGLYICSSSTPPGPGVHGMCGYYAANAALRGWR